jgi:crossover junction endodeoxyribonuclease RuvC
MSKRIIGIDPGLSGGIACLEVGDSGVVAQGLKMPGTERDVFDLLHDASVPEVFAYIEQVNAFPGQGRSSVFKFGQNYGLLRGCLIALHIPFSTVAAGKWQREMQCLSKKGMTKTQHKNQLKARAQELYPEIKITLANADALLIATYGLRRDGSPS